MASYGEILDRIAEIIQSAVESKQKNSKNIVSIRGYYVLKSDVLEFKELLELENTFYKLKTTENPAQKNNDLLKLCQVRASVQNDQTEDYIKLVEILSDAKGKNADELIEHLGYYIPKNSKDFFHELCQKLNVGPSVMLRDIYNEEAKQAIKSYLSGNAYQFYRIQKHILTKSERQLEKAPIARESLTIEELVVFLAERKDLNTSSLDLFLPILGIHNYYELVKGLYSLGAINKETFLMINKKMLEYDEIFVDVMDDYVNLTIGNNDETVKR